MKRREKRWQGKRDVGAENRSLETVLQRRKCVRKGDGNKHEKMSAEFSHGAVCCYIGKNRHSPYHRELQTTIRQESAAIHQRM